MTAVRALLVVLDDPAARVPTTAERAFLSALGGGCAAPIAAFGDSFEGEGRRQLRLSGLVASRDGREVVRATVAGEWNAGEALARTLADRAIALGARALLRMTTRPRVLVTRPRAQARDLVTALESWGAQAVLFPTVEILAPRNPAPIDRAVVHLAEYHWVVFTSANAVAAVFDRLGAAPSCGPRLAAVGPATAAEIRRRGGRVDFVPSEYLGAQLGRELPEVDGQRVLVPQGDQAGTALLDALMARGARVEAVEAYRTTPPERPDPGSARRPRRRRRRRDLHERVRRAPLVRAAGGRWHAPSAARRGDRVHRTGDGGGGARPGARGTRRARRAHRAGRGGGSAAPARGMIRLRRLRASPGLRRLVRETRLDPAHLIYPLFVTAAADQPRPIASMPGVSQWPVTAVVGEAERAHQAGIGAVLLFGIPRAKDATGSESVDDHGVIQEAGARAQGRGAQSAHHDRRVFVRVHRPRTLRRAEWYGRAAPRASQGFPEGYRIE